MGPAYDDGKVNYSRLRLLAESNRHTSFRRDGPSTGRKTASLLWCMWCRILWCAHHEKRTRHGQ